MLLFRRRPFLTVGLFLLLLLSLFFFLRPRAITEDQIAHAFFLGRNERAKELLSEVTVGIPLSKRLLFKGYIERALGDLEASDYAFLEAEEVSDPVLDGARTVEIYSNLLLNAFLEENILKMEQILVRAMNRVGKTDPWLLYFQGLIHYMKGDYLSASADFERTGQKVPLSKWMSVSFDRVFTPLFNLELEVNTLLGKGDFQKARRLVQQQLQKKEIENKEELQYLLAKTYFEQGKTQSPAGAVTYYQLAINALSDVDLRDPQFQERFQSILQLMAKMVDQLIEKKEYRQIPFYVSVLEDYEAIDLLERIKEHLTLVIEEDIEEQNWSSVRQAASVLNEILPEGVLRDSFVGRFDAMIQNAILSREMQSVLQYWIVLRTLAKDPSPYALSYIRALDQVFKEVILTDNESLTLTEEYFAFLIQLVNNPAARLEYAKAFFQFGISLFEEEETRGKGLRLMEISFTIPMISERASFVQDASNRLRALYESALLEDRIDEAFLILGFVRSMRLTGFDVAEMAQAKENLESALRYFRERNLIEAKRRANWVLVLDPENQDAKLLLGLIDYDLGDYQGAYEYFSSLETFTPEVLRALAVSGFFTSDKTSFVLLDQVERAGGEDRGMIRRLAYGSIVRNRPKEALYWLSKLESLESEEALAKATSLMDLGEYQESLPLFEMIDAPLLEAPFTKALKAVAKAMAVSPDEGKRLLEESSFDDLSIDKELFSEEFALFMAQRLVSQSREFALAQIYFMEGEYEKAVEELERIENPSPEQLFLLAKVHIELENLDRAREILELATLKIREKGEYSYLLPEADLFFGRLAMKRGHYIDAVTSFLKAEDKGALVLKDDILSLAVSAKISMLYDTAVKHFSTLLDRNNLPDAYFHELIESYIGSNQFDRAQEAILRKFSATPSLLVQLNLVPSLLVLRRIAAIGPILSQAERRELSDAELVSLFTALIKTAQYKKARELAQDNPERIREQASGLLGLATLHAIEGREEDALIDAYASLALDPINPETRQFIAENEKDPEVWRRRILSLERDIQEDGAKSLSLKKDLIEARIRLFQIEGEGSREALQGLYKALDEVRELSQKRTPFPMFPFLQGKALYYIGDFVEAFKGFRLAIEMNPSFIEAYEYLSRIYIRYQRDEQAEQVGLEIIRYNPINQDAWLSLAEIAGRKGNLLDAIDYLRRAIQFQPNAYRPYLLLSDLMLKLNNPEAALEALERAEAIKEDDEELLSKKLKLLYDPSHNFSRLTPRQLNQKRNETYQKLYQINPEAADRIRSDLPEQGRFEL